MLRNGLITVVNRSTLQQQQQQSIRGICGMSCPRCSKNSFNATRKANEGKLMNKLFGERVSGSKKRWYPTNEGATHSKHGGGLLFNASQLGRPGGAGKNTSRRSAVLNKLFMEEISSLLATGSIADNFLGRGLQLTRVKIALDFAFVNVYWLGNGDPVSDSKLSADLQHYSGLIRHELSKLRVMGEVPRIHFVQDKAFANMEHVEGLLRTLDLNQDFNESEEGNIDFQNGVVARVKQEFYGNKQELENAIQEDHEKSLPPMRHDVFGLDHRGIMSKILTKMRKSKQAWEVHSERQEEKASTSVTANEKLKETSILKSVEQQIAEAEKNSSETFKKFLAQRRDRKNTPERKKYRKADDISLIEVPIDANADITASKQQRDFLNQEDYLHEDCGSERKL